MTYVFDNCLGHVTNNTYHYHLPPTCLISQLGGVANTSWWYSGAWPQNAKPSPLIGWALDGWPIYGPYDENGDLQVGSSGGASATLDECNGKLLADRTYAYFTTPTYPYTIACFRGTPGRAVNRGRQSPVKSCPKNGLFSQYCDPSVDGSCDQSVVAAKPECIVCTRAFFLFPTCPAPQWDDYLIGCLAIAYCMLAVYLLFMYPFSWYFGWCFKGCFSVCSTPDDYIGSHHIFFHEGWVGVRKQRSDQQSERSLFDKLHDLCPLTVNFLTGGHFLKQLFNARPARILRSIVVACICRCIFYTADPYFQNESVHTLALGIIYGLAFAHVNEAAKDILILILWQCNMGLKSKSGDRLKKTLDLLAPIQIVVQVWADIFRYAGFTEVSALWQNMLMLCQIYFLTYSFFLACLQAYYFPGIWRYAKKKEGGAEKRYIQAEVVLVAMLIPTKATHAILALLNLGFIPGLSIEGVTSRISAMQAMDVLMFASFAIMSAFLVVAVKCLQQLAKHEPEEFNRQYSSEGSSKAKDKQYSSKGSSKAQDGTASFDVDRAPEAVPEPDLDSLLFEEQEIAGKQRLPAKKVFVNADSDDMTVMGDEIDTLQPSVQVAKSGVFNSFAYSPHGPMPERTELSGLSCLEEVRVPQQQRARGNAGYSMSQHVPHDDD